MIDLNEVYERVEKAKEYRDQLESYAVFLDGEEQELGAAMLRAAGKELVEIATLWYGAEHECARQQTVTLRTLCVSSEGRGLFVTKSFPMYPYISEGIWIEMPIPPDWSEWEAVVWHVSMSSSGVFVDVSDEDRQCKCVFDSMAFDDLKDGLKRCGYKVQEVKRVKSENV